MGLPAHTAAPGASLLPSRPPDPHGSLSGNF